MTVDVLRGNWKPPKLRWGALLACMLEVSMLVVMMTHRSIFGILCWVGNFYFSATCSCVFTGIFKEDDK